MWCYAEVHEPSVLLWGHWDQLQVGWDMGRVTTQSAQE